MGNEPFFMHYTWWKCRARHTGNSEFRSDNYRKTAAELCRVLWYESRSSFFLVDKRENIKGRRGWENAWWGFSQGCLSFPALMGLTRLSDSIITKSLRYESLSFVGLAISRSIFISREREFPKHFGYFPGISRELKTYLIANRKYPIFERKCIFWGSRIILSFVTIIFDSKVWFWAQRKISKIEWNRKICQSQYIKISRNFPGNRKNSRDQAGLKIFGKFPGFPGREFPGTSPNFYVVCSF